MKPERGGSSILLQVLLACQLDDRRKERDDLISHLLPVHLLMLQSRPDRVHGQCRCFAVWEEEEELKQESRETSSSPLEFRDALRYIIAMLANLRRR